MLFGAIALLLASVPILTFFVPIPDLTEQDILGFRIFTTVIALIVCIPLFAMSVSLFARMNRKYAVVANNEGLYIYASIFSLGFIPFAKIENIVWHSEHFTRHGRSLEIMLVDKHKLNLGLFYRIQAKILGYRYNDSLIFSLTLCKGKAEENAKAIIDAWQQAVAK